MSVTRKTRINPIRDPLPEGVFTDREEILGQLRRWAALAPMGGAKSDVLLGPRRVGKSAVLEQFYNDLFWEQKERIGGLNYKIVAGDLGLDPRLTKQKLDLLVEADILQRGWAYGFYRGLPDKMLGRVLTLEYAPEIRGVGREVVIGEVEAELRARIEALERERAGLRGRLNDLLGRATEVAVQRLMKRHFKNQVVDGRFFNVEREVLLPAFHRVRSVLTRAEGTEGYEIDNFGEPLAEGQPCWVTEQKAWAQPLPLAEAERFWRAAEALREDRGLEQVVLWLYARSGFSPEALAFLRGKGILYSDFDDLASLAQELGFYGPGWRPGED